MRGNLPAEDKLVVAGYILEMHQEPRVSNKTLVVQLSELLRLKYFSEKEVMDMLDKLIQEPSFEFYWSLPLEYSLQNLKFPLAKLLEKMNSGVTVFKPELNFVKAAVTIAMQCELQPDEQLSELR
jgi:hypothetical protein